MAQAALLSATSSSLLAGRVIVPSLQASAFPASPSTSGRCPALGARAILDPQRKVNTSKRSKSDAGIFGTSLELGLTKQNELFLGRLAMLGFAVSLLGEAMTGVGMLSLLEVQTGVTLGEAEPSIVLFILSSLMGAVGAFGDRGRFVEEEYSLHNCNGTIRGILGRDDSGCLLSGFSKAEELFVGRIAQLGFGISLMGELLSGKGMLAQLNLATCVPLNEMEPLLLFSIFLLFAAAVNPGHGKFTLDEEEPQD